MIPKVGEIWRYSIDGKKWATFVVESVSADKVQIDTFKSDYTMNGIRQRGFMWLSSFSADETYVKVEFVSHGCHDFGGWLSLLEDHK